MVDPLAILPILALALTIVCIPLLSDGPITRQPLSRTQITPDRQADEHHHQDVRSEGKQQCFCSCVGR
jgi:hypothetical protein